MSALSAHAAGDEDVYPPAEANGRVKTGIVYIRSRTDGGIALRVCERLTEHFAGDNCSVRAVLAQVDLCLANKESDALQV